MTPHLAMVEAQNAALRRIIHAHEENARLMEKARALGLEPPAMHLTMAMIAEEVAAEHGLSLDELKARSRRPAVSHPRHEAMWRMREVRRSDGRPRWSLPRIGAFFGVDHTTVMHGVRRVDRALAEAEAAWKPYREGGR